MESYLYLSSSGAFRAYFHFSYSNSANAQVVIMQISGKALDAKT